MVLPAWSAWMVHVPALSNATDVPLAEQTAGVVVENVTGSADDAVAATDVGDCNIVALAKAAKVIVWSAAVTVKVCWTGGAGLNVALPAWSAWMVQVPAASSDTDEPVTEHTAGVVVENVTAMPDDAVAPTVTGDCNIVALAKAANVIVWFSTTGLIVKLCCTGGAAL